MKKKNLAGTKITVSELCLGTANFGTTCSKENAFAQMDAFTELGGNFLDTAVVYGAWGGSVCASEKTIGEWFVKTGKRNQIVLSTKGCHPIFNQMDVPRVGAFYIKEDLECSLQNLQTEYIDLYFLHRDNPQVPVEEILETLEEQVKKGTIRYYGCSNWSLARIQAAQEYAKEHGLQGFSCNQVMYSLAKVNPQTMGDMVVMDEEMLQYHKDTQMNLMSFMCQAGGYFQKRITGEKISKEYAAMYQNAENERILEQMRKHLTLYAPNAWMLQYVTKSSFPAVPIGGFRNVKQLREAVLGLQKEIPEELLF
ncbi:MAG: aldo/keto reductase [Ruminococcus sp.]|nr:aldo/keto reductase [Ruminococcus sp.]